MKSRHFIGLFMIGILALANNPMAKTVECEHTVAISKTNKHSTLTKEVMPRYLPRLVKVLTFRPADFLHTIRARCRKMCSTEPG